MKKYRFMTLAILLSFMILAGCAEKESGGAATQLPGGTPQPSVQQQSQQSGSGGGQQEQQQRQGGSQMLKAKQLISKEEAAQILGEPVRDCIEEDQKVLGMAICVYAPEDTKSMSYLQVVLIQPGALQQDRQEPSDKGQSGESQGQSGGEQGQSGESQGQQGREQGQSQGSQEQEPLSPKSIFEAIKSAFADFNAPPSGYVGNDTFISAKGMSVLSGEHYIHIAVGNADPAKAEDLTKLAAELAVTNLKRLMGE